MSLSTSRRSSGTGSAAADVEAEAVGSATSASSHHLCSRLEQVVGQVFRDGRSAS